jgi:hypothetical protein
MGGHAPDSTRESLVEDFDDNADVGIGIARRHERRVDVGNPHLAERSIQCWENERAEVEQ